MKQLHDIKCQCLRPLSPILPQPSLTDRSISSSAISPPRRARIPLPNPQSTQGQLLRSCNSRASDLEDPAQARSRPLCSNACPALLEGATLTGRPGGGKPWSDAAEAAKTAKASARGKLTVGTHLSFWAD